MFLQFNNNRLDGQVGDDVLVPVTLVEIDQAIFLEHNKVQKVDDLKFLKDQDSIFDLAVEKLVNSQRAKLEKIRKIKKGQAYQIVPTIVESNGVKFTYGLPGLDQNWFSINKNDLNLNKGEHTKTKCIAVHDSAGKLSHFLDAKYSPLATKIDQMVLVKLSIVSYLEAKFILKWFESGSHNERNQSAALIRETKNKVASLGELPLFISQCVEKALLYMNGDSYYQTISLDSPGHIFTPDQLATKFESTKPLDYLEPYTKLEERWINMIENGSEARTELSKALSDMCIKLGYKFKDDPSIIYQQLNNVSVPLIFHRGVYQDFGIMKDVLTLNAHHFAALASINLDGGLLPDEVNRSLKIGVALAKFLSDKLNDKSTAESPTSGDENQSVDDYIRLSSKAIEVANSMKYASIGQFIGAMLLNHGSKEYTVHDFEYIQDIINAHIDGYILRLKPYSSGGTDWVNPIIDKYKKSHPTRLLNWLLVNTNHYKKIGLAEAGENLKKASGDLPFGNNGAAFDYIKETPLNEFEYAGTHIRLTYLGDSDFRTLQPMLEDDVFTSIWSLLSVVPYLAEDDLELLDDIDISDATKMDIHLKSDLVMRSSRIHAFSRGSYGI